MIQGVTAGVDEEQEYWIRDLQARADQAAAVAGHAGVVELGQHPARKMLRKLETSLATLGHEKGRSCSGIDFVSNAAVMPETTAFFYCELRRCVYCWREIRVRSAQGSLRSL
jgi:hypothetical protein